MDLLEYRKQKEEHANMLADALQDLFPQEQNASASAENIFRILPEPSTLMMLMETSMKVMSFLKKSIEDDNDLIEIKSQLQEINKKLTEIINLLIDLKIHISEEFRKLVERFLLSEIATIHDSYEGWKLNPHKPNTQEQSNNSMTTIQSHAEMAMLYGNAHFNSVGLAMFYELMMHRLLQTPLVSIRNRLDRYRRYFLSVLGNVTIKGCLAYERNEVNQTILSLHASTPEFGLKEIHVATTYWNGGGERCKIDWAEMMAVSGNLADGFKAQFQIVEKDRVCRDVGPPKLDTGSISGSRDASAPSSFSYEFMEYWNYYTRAHLEYRNKLLPQKKSLEEAILLCQSYIDFTNNFSFE